MPRIVSIGWTMLVIVGILIIILAVGFISGYAGLVAAALMIITWICWGLWTTWHFGIRRHVRKHLGGEPKDWQVVIHVIPTTERVNVQMALDHLRGTGARALPFFGIRLIPFEDHHEAIQGSDITGIVRSNPWPEPLQWESFPRSLKDKMHCATNALYLLRAEGVSFCALSLSAHTALA